MISARRAGQLSVLMVGVLALGALTALGAPSDVRSDVRSGTEAVQRPALVVLIAIDQFRGDYPDRFGAQLTGGIARLRDHGAFFPHAWQDHANTETAPGHSTMLSGREPVHTEIISNNRGVPDPDATLVEAAGPGASPRRFNGTALYDWLVARDPNVRVVSVSRKDRGAILPVGRGKGDVYWFADGKFTTSRYYSDTLAGWVRAFNARIPYDRLAGSKWELLLPADQYPEPDSVPVENSGADYTFPHRLPTDLAILRNQLQLYPWMDSLTLALALDGVRARGLGQRALESANAMPDLLVVSLSTTDAVGHAFGPDSRELHDQVLRVDRWLGAFFQELESTIPPERIVYAMTGDHGVSPLPELDFTRTHRGGRVWLSDIATQTERALQDRYHADFGLEFDNGLVYADLAAMRVRHINVDSVARAIVNAGTSRRGIAVGFIPATLATSRDSAAVRWRRTLPASLGWIAAFAASPGYIWSPGRSIAEHGTPNALDLSVPVAFYGAGIMAGRHERLVRTVDIAPTLAALLGVQPLDRLDGVALPEVVGRVPRSAAQR